MRAQNVQSSYTRSQGEGRELDRKFLLFWVLLSLVANTHAIPTARFTASSCPIDLRYVGTIPWDYTTCTHINNNNNTDCCQTLLSLYGVGLSQHLKSTSQFHLLDFSISAACLSDLQSILTSSFSLPSTIVSSCFPSPARFVITPQSCAGIETKEDWIKKLGNRTALDDSCKEDLSVVSAMHASTQDFGFSPNLQNSMATPHMPLTASILLSYMLLASSMILSLLI